MNPTDEQKKALDMKTSVCVTASAGTGKTFILTKRYIESLRVGKIDAGKILALTYTDKAAAEMREKIEREIRREFDETGEFETVLENIHKCSISTFHGFCASLLKEFPIEAGVEPGFSVMDDLDKSELVENTISDVLKKPPESLKDDVIHLYRHCSGGVIRTGILYLLGEWDECRAWFGRLKSNPESVACEWRSLNENQILRTKEMILSDKKISELMGYFEKSSKNGNSVMKKWLSAYNKLKSSDVSENTAALMNIMNVKPGTFDEEIPTDLIDNFVAQRKKIRIYDPAYLEDKYMVFVFSVLNALGNAVSYIYERITEEKERASVLDFDDLVRFTSRLIDNETVSKTLQSRYDYILVDEVQDNDPILTGIVKKICGNAVGKGRLFIVGDVKQSIYGFRGSDPQGFYELRDMLGNEVSLDKSFRTVPEIIGCVNTIFSDVFEDNKIDYNEIKTSRETDSGTVSILQNEHLVGNNSDVNSAAESELIASWIKKNAGTLEVYENEVRRPSRFSDFAILLRTRTKIANLKKALDRYGVPYFEYKGKDFYKSQEIYDIVNVLKSVAFEEDDVALYGALRSPYFGISDELLCRCSVEKTTEPLIRRLEMSDKPEIVSALSLLNEFRSLSHQMTLVRFVEEIIKRSGILSVYSALSSGGDKIANIEKFVDIVSAKTFGNAVSLPSFIKTIDTCIEEGISEEGGYDEDDSDGSDRVKLLTIHASKGLEYPVVILAFASDEKRQKSSGIYFDKEAGASLSLNYPGEKKILSFVYEYRKSDLTKKEMDEGKRLYYVGMTRARDHLVVSKTNSEKISPTSFIGMHDIEGEIFDEPLCSCVLRDECSVSTVDGWHEISPESVSEEVTESGFDANEYLLAKGSCLHEIFAGGDIFETAKRYGFSDCEEEFETDLKMFMESELMKDALDSFCELSVSEAEENKRIDRLVKYKNGSYAIIDYKLGSTESISAELMEKYRVQLSRYSEMMSEVLGCDVPSYLYLVSEKDEKKRIVRIV